MPLGGDAKVLAPPLRQHLRAHRQVMCSAQDDQGDGAGLQRRPDLRLLARPHLHRVRLHLPAWGDRPGGVEQLGVVEGQHRLYLSRGEQPASGAEAQQVKAVLLLTSCFLGRSPARCGGRTALITEGPQATWPVGPPPPSPRASVGPRAPRRPAAPASVWLPRCPYAPVLAPRVLPATVHPSAAS